VAKSINKKKKTSQGLPIGGFFQRQCIYMVVSYILVFFEFSVFWRCPFETVKNRPINARVFVILWRGNIRETSILFCGGKIFKKKKNFAGVAHRWFFPTAVHLYGCFLHFGVFLKFSVFWRCPFETVKNRPFLGIFHKWSCFSHFVEGKHKVFHESFGSSLLINFVLQLQKKEILLFFFFVEGNHKVLHGALGSSRL